MKKLILLISLSAANLMAAQELQGIATYRTSRKVDIKMDSTARHNEAMTKELKEELRKAFDKENQLVFTKEESLYTEIEKLELEDPRAGNTRIQIIGHSGQAPLYKNISKGTFVRQEELLGKRFLVKDSLERPDWKLEQGQKKIGNHTCYKATWARQVERVNWDHEAGVTDSTVVIVTTAWYTPEIPVSHGPQKYWGLPGLILEVQEEDLVYLCTSIVLNPKEKPEIAIPDKGKDIDQVSFEKIRQEKNREMLEQFQKGRDKGSIRIRG